MKLLTTTAVLALATCVRSIPNDELQKRATCTIFGFKYPCSSTAGAPTTTTTSRAGSTPPTTSANPTSPPSGGGKSAYTSGSTASDIDNNTGCTALTVIYARGTSEGGNIGSIAGPSMFKQLLSDLGASSVTLQGVNYPADSAGNANCGAAGGPQMASEVKSILARCPNTKIALSGYSQGACVVHNAAASQGLDNSQIAAVVVFGDPFNGQAVGKVPASKVRSICASGDPICRTATTGSGSGHLSYGGDAAQAADFIESTTGV